jgi:16S rRNA (guanine527-N7)-methyltransferase
MKKSVEHVSRETLLVCLRDGASALGITLCDEQTQQLIGYLELLLKWNRVYNLTSVRDPMDMMRLHLLDSMAVSTCVEHALFGLAEPRLLDVGSGAGLPGLVLAILHPRWHVTVCDAVQKKVAFMVQVIGQLKLRNARAVHGRVESLVLPAMDAAVSRAFSDIALFAHLASPHLTDAGLLLAMQGKAQDQVPNGFSRRALHRITVPGLEAERHLLVLETSKG